MGVLFSDLNGLIVKMRLERKSYEDKSEYVIGGASSSDSRVSARYRKGHVLIRNLFSASKKLRNRASTNNNQ